MRKCTVKKIVLMGMSFFSLCNGMESGLDSGSDQRAKKSLPKSLQMSRDKSPQGPVRKVDSLDQLRSEIGKKKSQEPQQRPTNSSEKK